MFGAELDLLDYINAPVFVLDASDETNPTYLAFNAYACNVGGLTSENVIGKNAKQIYPGRFGELAFRRHRQTIRTARATCYDLTLELNGVERQIETTLAPVFDKDGRLSRLIGTSLDVSKNRAGQSKRQGTRQGIEILTGEMEQFISLAAHDLRSPMQNVRQLADLILEDFKDLGDGKVDMIRMLERVATTSLNMITDLLTATSVVDASENIVEFSLSDVVSEILVSLDPNGTHQVRCSAQQVKADRTVVQIVLRNLIDNALKHSGKSVVTLSISVGPGAPGFVELILKDNGIGFPDPTIAFFDSGELRPESGFGLLGVRRLLETRGGSISAQNPDGGEGCVIRFRVPGSIVTGVSAELVPPYCGTPETHTTN